MIRRQPVILQPNLQPCVIFELRCRNCGPVRIGVSRNYEEAPAELNCPYCTTAAPAWLLGAGQTKRLLPYFDHVPDNFEIEQRSTLCDGGLLLRIGWEFLRVDSQAAALDEVRSRLAS
jgi:hypothetical protein